MSSNGCEEVEEELPATNWKLLDDPKLPDDVRTELSNEKYINRMHYSRATYAKGCHGPLCRLAERDRGRDRSVILAERAGREYEPNHEERARRANGVDRDRELYSIVHRHRNEVEIKRLEKQANRRWGPM